MESRKSWLVAAVVAAALVYVAMWLGYTENWAWLDDVDNLLLQRFHDVAATRPGWVSFWVTFSIVFGPSAFRIIALVLIIAALVRRNLQTALFLVVSVELSGLVTLAAKAVADRPRPDTALAHAASTSFPSGHALGVMVGVLALLTVLWPYLAAGLRLPVTVLSIALIVLVGVARVVLNVHHPSDVLAGWALGFLYYLFCVRLAPPRPVTSAAETPAELDTAR
ncbi:phosphatase PAP2 family protein [Mycolicibacterium sp. CH28]|uniref:phosphatase PAP2 family protein n=1 Tax=Mycolicibacterium sp. CH28 TaxID=2512237 RepID=UPI001080963F|nr:phosphatase PAP2 family protein [Mycolicibacterium sp. CH28]TGD89252.1 phosphatase PAP2 family protein [Mycolicibacterium sp. CH28]